MGTIAPMRRPVCALTSPSGVDLAARSTSATASTDIPSVSGSLSTKYGWAPT